MISIAPNSTDVTIDIYAVEDTTGLPALGLAYSDMTASYHRTRSARQPITPASVTVAAAHTDGGVVEVDATNEKGVYRFDVPDAAFASGADFVTIVLQASGVIIAPVRVQLQGGFNDQVATDVHLCKAALVNKRIHTISTGVDVIKDDDGTTTLVTLTPADVGNDQIEVTPS